MSKRKGIWNQAKESNKITYSKLTTEILEDFLEDLSRNIKGEGSRDIVIPVGELTSKQIEYSISNDDVRRKELKKEIDIEIARLKKERLIKVVTITGFSRIEAKLIDERYSAYNELGGELSWKTDYISLGDDEYDDSYEVESLSCKKDVWKLTRIYSDGHYENKILREEELTLDQVKERFLSNAI